MVRQRNARYKITVYSKTETTIVEYPITCKFNVTRGVFSESNKASIQLYNLASKTRNQIFQDQYTFDLEKQKYVRLEAGWDGSMSLIFVGRIMQAYSHKAGGQTDVITDIQAVALDIFDGQSSYTFAAGTTFKDALKTMAADFPNIILANIGTLEGTFKTPTTFEGSTIDCINTLTGGQSFVDNGTLNTLMNNEVIDVPVPVISSTTNLLETPMRRDANLEIKTLFLPDIITGQLVEVSSDISPDFNGQFKLVGFTHDCLISPTQAGTRTTQMTLWIGPMLPGADIAITGGAAPVEFSKVKGEEVSPVKSRQPAAVLDVYSFIQKNGYAPKTKITNNIYWSEVVKPNSLKYSKPSIEVLRNLYSTAQRIQTFKDKYYPGATLQINSGWRSRGYNSTLSNADPNSEHIYGNAIDFKIVGHNTHTVYLKFKVYWKGRHYEHKSYGFIHADQTKNRGVIADW